MSLFHHRIHPHKPVNVNEKHRQEQSESGLNQRIAVGMTHVFQSMWTFWGIVAWIVLWILANATIAHFDPMPWPLLLCLASVPQLPLMIVIMVGQGLLGRHQEIMAEEAFQTTTKSYQDIEQIMEHLAKQDKVLMAIAEKQGISLNQLLEDKS